MIIVEEHDDAKDASEDKPICHSSLDNTSETKKNDDSFQTP